MSEIKGLRVAFVGKLGGFSRPEAQRLVREHAGIPVRRPIEADWVVLGADEQPWIQSELLDAETQAAVASGQIQLVHETQFWERLGLVEAEGMVRRLYTPAMLADLMGVTVRVVRGWHRHKLITPVREVHRLPYFDFQEVASARRLAQLLAAGASPQKIQQDLAQLSQLVPGVERPLAQLSVIVEGRHLLLRQGAGLIEPGGQLRFDFEALEQPAEPSPAQPAVLPFRSLDVLVRANDAQSIEDMLRLAGDLEDVGDYATAIEVYRTVLMAGGPNAEVNFRLAELLFMEGDLPAARERYAVAIELEDDFVEARANLGCVLADLGSVDLAIAAFRSALKLHPEYPDAHYHLAHLLEDQGDIESAHDHWKQFVRLSPDSPWAVEAWHRLGRESSGSEDRGEDWFDWEIS